MRLANSESGGGSRRERVYARKGMDPVGSVGWRRSTGGILG